MLAEIASLAQAVAWPIIALVILFCYRKNVGTILDAIKKRIESGSSLEAGPLKLGEDKDLRQLPHVDQKDDGRKKLAVSENIRSVERNDIYKNNRGVFLAHVISPSTISGQKYDIYIYLIRHKSKDLSDIDKAEFFFGQMWGDMVFEERLSNGMIGVSTSAYGPFLCTCKVYFKDGSSISINRYIDFEMGRMFKRLT